MNVGARVANVTTLDAALLRAVSAHPGLRFLGLCDAAWDAGLDASVTEIDQAARALKLEHGEPGAYRYRLPRSGPVVLAVEPPQPPDPHARTGVEGAEEVVERGFVLPPPLSNGVAPAQIDHIVIHPDTIASSPAQSTLQRAGA